MLTRVVLAIFLIGLLSPAPAAEANQASALLDSLMRVEQPPWEAGVADVAAWRLKATTRLGGAPSGAAVSLDRATVAATGHREGSLHVVDALTLKPRTKIMLTGYEPYSLGGVAMLPDGKRLAFVRNGTLEVYDIASKARVQSIPSRQGDDRGHLALSRNGQRLYFIRSSISFQRSTISVFTTASEALTLAKEFPFDVRIDSFDVTADGEKFLFGTFPTFELVLFDAGARKIIWAEQCQCSGRFGTDDRLIAFAGRPGASAGDFGKNAVIGVLNVAEPRRRVTFDTKTEESLSVEDVSPDGLLAAIGSTNNGHVSIVRIALDAPKMVPVTTLKDNSGQSIVGAKFVGRDSLVTMSGDNNARLWGRMGRPAVK